jgi:acetyl esterase
MRAARAAAGAVPLYTMTLAAARAADLADIQAAAGSPEPVHSVDDRTIPGPGGELAIRVYRPAGDGPLPVLLYFFGGGWVLGTIDTSDAICRSLTNTVGCVTIAVGYRLAPEHPFPAAVYDCFAALTWVAAHADELAVDPSRIAVGGDSAGGNLSAAVTLLARDSGGPALVHQLLIYPNTAYEAGTESLRENTDPLLFNRTSVGWYWDHYLTSAADGANPLASPLRAADHSGLPPATVITAEFDPLRDEGEAYAAALDAAGVPVELTRYDGMVHGFFAMSGVLDTATRAVAHAAARLRVAFGLSTVEQPVPAGRPG